MTTTGQLITNIIQNHPTAMVGATSMVVATTLGVLGYISDRKRQKRLHTLTVLSAVDDNAMLVEANFELTKMMIENKPPNYEDMSDKERKFVLTMLNYYEFVSTALRMRALDRTSLLVQRYGLMSSTFNYFKPFIDYRRKKLNRPHAFEGVEFIVENEKKRYESLCKKYEVRNLDSFRSIDRKSAIDRTLRYPYDFPKKSYVFVSGKAEPITSSIAELIIDKIPVIAYGSNASPEALNRKFKDDAKLYSSPIPVITATLEDYCVVFAAQFSPYGALPATIQPSKGSKIQTAITFLNKDQLQRMHETEDLGFYYSFNKIHTPLTLEDGTEIENSFAYVALGGSININEGFIGLEAIDQKITNGELISQYDAQKIVIKKLGLNLEVNDFIAENALNEKKRNERFKILSEKTGHIWQIASSEK